MVVTCQIVGFFCTVKCPVFGHNSIHGLAREVRDCYSSKYKHEHCSSRHLGSISEWITVKPTGIAKHNRNLICTCDELLSLYTASIIYLTSCISGEYHCKHYFASYVLLNNEISPKRKIRKGSVKRRKVKLVTCSWWKYISFLFMYWPCILWNQKDIRRKCIMITHAKLILYTGVSCIRKVLDIAGFVSL